MLGVVLWKDAARQKAVVWCEDHANLAFYSDNGDSNLVVQGIDIGDVIRFDLTIENNTRYVSNPELVLEQKFPELPSILSNSVVALEFQGRRALDRTGQRPDRQRPSYGEVVQLGAA